MKNPCEHRRQYEGKWMACEFHNEHHNKNYEPCPKCQRRDDYYKTQCDPDICTYADFNGVYENYEPRYDIAGAE